MALGLVATVAAVLGGWPYVKDELAIHKLASADVGVRSAAVRRIVERKLYRAIPALLGALTKLRWAEDSSRDAYIAISNALSNLVTPHAFSVVEPLLHDSRVEVRSWLASRLDQLGPTALPALLDLLADPNDDVHASALNALMHFGPLAAPVVKALKKYVMANGDTDTALCLIHSGEDVSGLALDLLKLPQENIRTAGCLAIANIASLGSPVPEARDLLVGLASDARAGSGLRQAAATALKLLRQGDQVHLRLDPEPRDRAATMLPIASCSDTENLIGLLASRQDAPHAALSIARIGPPAVPALLRSFEDADTRVRTWIACTLGRIGTGAAAAEGILSRAASASDEALRLTSMQALQRIRGKGRLPPNLGCIAFLSREVWNGRMCVASQHFILLPTEYSSESK